LSVAGLVAAVVGVRRLVLAANPLQDEATAFTLVGLCILFFGAMNLLPNAVGFRQRLLLALSVTCMALTFDWVAFIPGPREFHAAAGSGAVRVGTPVSSTVGRGAFGIIAVMMDIFSIYAWRLALRLLMTGSEAKRSSDTR
jgi:hypothetical protein